jgi:hypothetical protein
MGKQGRRKEGGRLDGLAYVNNAVGEGRDM